MPVVTINLYHRVDEEEGKQARHVAKYFNVKEFEILDGGVLWFTTSTETIITNLPFKIIEENKSEEFDGKR